MVDEGCGKIFWYHDDGKSTTWYKPDWVPQGWIPDEAYWQEYTSDQGRPYFYNARYVDRRRCPRMLFPVAIAFLFLLLLLLLSVPAHPTSSCHTFILYSTGTTQWDAPGGPPAEAVGATSDETRTSRMARLQAMKQRHSKSEASDGGYARPQSHRKGWSNIRAVQEAERSVLMSRRDAGSGGIEMSQIDLLVLKDMSERPASKEAKL